MIYYLSYEKVGKCPSPCVDVAEEPKTAPSAWSQASRKNLFPEGIRKDPIPPISLHQL
jgi:hypothetical protein